MIGKSALHPIVVSPSLKSPACVHYYSPFLPFSSFPPDFFLYLLPFLFTSFRLYVLPTSPSSSWLPLPYHSFLFSLFDLLLASIPSFSFYLLLCFPSLLPHFISPPFPHSFIIFYYISTVTLLLSPLSRLHVLQ